MASTNDQNQDLLQTARWGPRATRAATILLGLYFAIRGILKLTAPETLAASFAHWDDAAWLPYAVGATEILSGGLLVLRPTTALGGLLLTGVMAGAVLTHADAGEWSLVPMPFALALATGAAAWHYAPAGLKTRLNDLDLAPVDA